MVHKRPPAAGDLAAAYGSGKDSAWQTSIDRLRKNSACASSRSRRRLALLDDGATVPFVARYRKEATGGLDDAQLRKLEERLTYLRELEARRIAILNSIREQGKLDAALEAAILAADSKGRLEDIYLPFKPKRRTKAEIAKEAGLEPLAELLLTQPQSDPTVVAAALSMPTRRWPMPRPRSKARARFWWKSFAEDADLIGALREQMWSNGKMSSAVRKGKKTEGEKFKDYFDFSCGAAQAAVAPHPRDVPRREGGDPRPADPARGAAAGAPACRARTS